MAECSEWLLWDPFIWPVMNAGVYLWFCTLKHIFSVSPLLGIPGRTICFLKYVFCTLFRQQNCSYSPLGGACTGSTETARNTYTTKCSIFLYFFVVALVLGSIKICCMLLFFAENICLQIFWSCAPLGNTDMCECDVDLSKWANIIGKLQVHDALPEQ